MVYSKTLKIGHSQGEHSVMLSTFIKLPFVIKISVLSIFEWPLYTVFTVHVSLLFNDWCPSLSVVLRHHFASNDTPPISQICITLAF